MKKRVKILENRITALENKFREQPMEVIIAIDLRKIIQAVLLTIHDLQFAK